MDYLVVLGSTEKVLNHSITSELSALAILLAEKYFENKIC